MNKHQFGPWWLLLFFWAELCFMELVVHAATAPQFWQPELVLLMLYPLVPAVLLFALCRLFPPRANRVLGPVCSGLCYIFFASQLVYYSIFHCFYSAYSMGNGGQVMQFWKVTLHAIRKNWLPLSLMLLPPVGHAVLGKRFSAARLRLPYLPAFAALAAAVHFGLMALLPVFGTQPLSAYDLYHNTNDMKQTTAHLGLMPAFRLDVHRLLFGFEGGEIELATETKAPMEAPTEAPTEPPATEPAAPSCTVSISCTTVLDNWDKLSEAKRSIVPSNGIILGTVTVELQEGDTVFSVLQRVVSDYNIQMEYSVSPLYQTTYIEGLGNLYEKDCGARSGWMFAVNGVFPNYGASDCTVQDGDSIRWLYTCDLGSDLS